MRVLYEELPARVVRLIVQRRRIDRFLFRHSRGRRVAFVLGAESLGDARGSERSEIPDLPRPEKIGEAQHQQEKRRGQPYLESAGGKLAHKFP